MKLYLKREIRFVGNFVFSYFKNGFRHKNALFYPEYPDKRAAICKVLSALGYNITNNPKRKFDIAFYWEDTTFRKESQFLQSLSKKCRVINLRCLDISKRKVEAVFHEVFGYGSFVDPTTHRGKCVRKSDLNARHDGLVLDCPIDKPEPGYIYQKLLDQIDDQQLVIDYRVAVFGSEIAYFKLRYKKLEDRFAHTNRERVMRVEEALSVEEKENIIRFCQKLGMDYGELDMIRDQNDRRLYIVDANSTPFRPPPEFNVSDEDRKRMVRKSKRSFQRQFL